MCRYVHAGIHVKEALAKAHNEYFAVPFFFAMTPEQFDVLVKRLITLGAPKATCP